MQISYQSYAYTDTYIYTCTCTYAVELTSFLVPLLWRLWRPQVLSSRAEYEDQLAGLIRAAPLNALRAQSPGDFLGCGSLGYYLIYQVGTTDRAAVVAAAAFPPAACQIFYALCHMIYAVLWDVLLIYDVW